MKFPFFSPTKFSTRLETLTHQLNIDLIAAKFAEIDAHAYHQALTLKRIHLLTLTGNLDHAAKVSFPTITEPAGNVFRTSLGIDKAGQKSPRG